MTISIEKFINFCKISFNESPKVIFEIGAREANDSILLKNTFPLADVYAFEAHPKCYDLHKDNVEKNNIKYYNFGMWNTETTMTFYDKNIHSGISSFRNRGNEYGTDTITLNTITPLKFCKKNNITNIDILKLDVEGCSYEILEGFGELIKNINLIHVETEQAQHFEGQHTEEKVFNFLINNNFEMVEHSWCCLSQYDSIWRKR